MRTGRLVRLWHAVRDRAAARPDAARPDSLDPLTGLANRRRVVAEIQRLVAGPAGAGDRVWVFLLDLDGFRRINESAGHDVGDRVILEVARRLTRVLPAAAVPARIGGDRFVVAYAGDQEHALRLTDEIRGCFVEPVRVDGNELTAGASIGIAHAVAGGPAVSAEALMRDADTALHRSKAEGPGRSTVFDTSMHDRIRDRVDLEEALRTALADDQLHVAYQPVVQLGTGHPVGAEALVRWVHPERGPVPPLAFIPVAEDAGLIGRIGTWVREEALRQLGAWRADGTVADDFYLSVNVSPHQLGDPGLPAQIATELARFGVPARAVALELTESVLVDGSSVTSRVLFELRELGLRLLVDDFGTGVSALGHLRRFPVTGVKIDRSFVAGLGQSAEDEEIVRAVVAMSHALGLTIVAEGVETRPQRDALAATGVTHGQGWLWGPAVPAGEFAAHWHAGGPAAQSAAARAAALP